MGYHAETIIAYKNKIARAFMVGVLTSFVVLTPAIAQSPLSDFAAGKSYHDGDGVAQDYSRARSLYERAADDGSTYAMINLGYMYYFGQGVAQDYDVARDWYIRAERNGSTIARDNLEGLYSLGLSSPPAISGLSASEGVESEELVAEEMVSGETAIETPIAAPEPEPEISNNISSTPSAIGNDEALSPPPETPLETLPRVITQAPSITSTPLDTSLLLPEIISAPEPPKTATDKTGADETGSQETDSHDRPAETQKPAQLTFKKPSFNIAKLIPYLILFGLLLCLLGIIGLIRFMIGGPRRFVESFMHAHDYGLRRMYSHFLQTSRSDINRENWLRGVSDMIVRHAHDAGIAAAHTKQAYLLQEAAKDSQQAARRASASLTLHAEELIVKSYERLGPPD